LAALCVAVYLFVEVRRLRRRAWRTTAEVIGYHSEQVTGPPTEPNLFHWPVFAFHDEAGVRQGVKGYWGCDERKYNVGDRVPILYVPDERPKVFIDTFASQYLSVCAGLGVAAISLVPLILSLLM